MTEGSHGDSWARGVLASVWDSVTHAAPDPTSLQAVQAIGRFEGRYGYPSADRDPAWQGSHNWGAVQEGHPTPENSFEHTDHRADGSTYVGHFKRYASDQAGARDLLHEIWRRPGVRAALPTGSASAIAQAMSKSGYFEAGADKYASAIARHARAIAQSIGEPVRVTLGGTGSSEDGTSILLLAAAVWYFSRKGRENRWSPNL